MGVKSSDYEGRRVDISTWKSREHQLMRLGGPRHDGSKCGNKTKDRYLGAVQLYFRAGRLPVECENPRLLSLTPKLCGFAQIYR